MSKVTVQDKMPQFKRSLYSVLDDAIREAGRDTLIKAKNKAPYAKGGLRSNSVVDKVVPLKYRVSFWIEYARFQEFGGDSNRTVKKYTTGGTGKHFLRNAGDEESKKLPMTFKKHAQRARA